MTRQMARWKQRIETSEKAQRATTVSRNGTVVLAARARRAAGIAPGDQVVTIPVGPGAVLVERVQPHDAIAALAFLESDDNPLRGAWGDDPQAYVDELRGG